MYVGQWPTFHGLVKTIWWINVVLEILIQCDTTLTWNYICRSLTYISWSSDFSLYLEDKCHNWNIGSMWCKDFPQNIMYVNDLHFMGQWFSLISWRLFDGEMLYWRYWFSATLSLTYKYIFHGTVMPYIFNTIWWTSLILWILVQCDMGHWHVFHDLEILNHLPMVCWSWI